MKKSIWLAPLIDLPVYQLIKEVIEVQKRRGVFLADLNRDCVNACVI